MPRRDSVHAIMWRYNNHRSVTGIPCRQAVIPDCTVAAGVQDSPVPESTVLDTAQSGGKVLVMRNNNYIRRDAVLLSCSLTVTSRNHNHSTVQSCTEQSCTPYVHCTALYCKGSATFAWDGFEVRDPWRRIPRRLSLIW